MQPLRGCKVLMLLQLVAKTGLVAAIFLLYLPAFAQQNLKDSVQTFTDSTKTAVIDDVPDIITTFKALNFPPEMLMHYGEISPQEIVTLIDEFQVTQKDEDGVAMLITVKLRFDSDRLVGYIHEAPIENTQNITVSDFKVKIPIEWLCTPGSPDHPQHYVSSLAAITTAEKEYKCTGWHIKLPELERPDLGSKGKKEKKKKTKKSTAPANPTPP